MIDKEYLIGLPWPPAKSSPNGSQGDFRGKAAAGKRYKDACAWSCRAGMVRPLSASRVQVEVTFHAPPRGNQYDLDNIAARCKRGFDAVAEAIGIDDRRWVSLNLRRGEPIKGGAVLVHVKPAENWKSIGHLAAQIVKEAVS